MADAINKLDDRIDVLKWVLVTLKAIQDGPEQLGKEDVLALKQSCETLIPDVEKMIEDFNVMMDNRN